MSEEKKEEKKPDSEPKSEPEPKQDKIILVKKTCPECKEEKTFKGDTAKQDASIWMSEHLEKKHPEEEPEPTDKYFEDEKKKGSALTCERCGHTVVSATLEKAEELLATHKISHEHETNLEKRDKLQVSGDVVMFSVGVVLFIVSIAIIAGALYMSRKNKLDDKTKDESK